MNEWNIEQDAYYFFYRGFDCHIVRIPGYGYLCGFIITEQAFSPDIKLDVHGGITIDDGLRLGFDCGAIGDLIPGLYEDGFYARINDRAEIASMLLTKVEKALKELLSKKKGSILAEELFTEAFGVTPSRPAIDSTNINNLKSIPTEKLYLFKLLTLSSARLGLDQEIASVTPVYRNIEFVTNELKRMVDQIIEQISV